MKYQTNEIDMTEERRGESRENDRSCLRNYQTLVALSSTRTKYSLCPKYIEFRSNGLKSPL